MKLSPHSFLTTEAHEYPGLPAVPARLVFPDPFAFGDYKAWHRALAPLEAAEEGDWENGLLMRQYRAAMAVATLEDVDPAELEDAELENPDFSLDDVDPEDEELPMAFLSWVTDCADACIGPQIVVENLQETLARRQASSYMGATFHAGQALRLLPDLQAYSGSTVTFHGPLTKRHYKAWDRARRILPKYDPRDVENGMLARQWRAALTLVETWDVKGVEWKAALHRNDEVPLVIVSWVVEAADAYLSKRINLKKLLSGSSSMR